MTLQFFGNDDFSVIITFCVVSDSFYSHVYGSVRLTFDSDLTTDVGL